MKSILVKLSLFFLVMVSLISCQKEVSDDIIGGNANSPLLGTWKFSYLDVKAKIYVVTTDGVDEEKAITLTNYTTTNNKGNAVFTASDFMSEGLSYDINTISNVYFYTNGVLEDSLIFPFQVSVPPISASGKYQLVGTDSVYFKGGFIEAGLDSMATKSIGYKFFIAGNKLTLTTKFKYVYNEIDQGVNYLIDQNADIKVVMQK
ncbi:MAG TPA: hypothetical protein VFN30_09715 [Chitinophagaceae bacterium]|nr:hypothetical protein [Chitinophagaceae bacterium]